MYFLLYIYVVGMSVVCQITWNHVNQIRPCSKSVLGGKIRPVTPIVFFSKCARTIYILLASERRERDTLRSVQLRIADIYKTYYTGQRGI